MGKGKVKRYVHKVGMRHKSGRNVTDAWDTTQSRLR